MDVVAAANGGSGNLAPGMVEQFNQGPVTYYSGFLSPERSDQFFSELWDGLPWERRPDAPRREYWTNTFGRAYTYGRDRGQRTYQSQPEHASITWVREALVDVLGFRFNACFANGYENARDHLGWHADNSPDIDHTFPIVVVTVGGGRHIEVQASDPMQADAVGGRIRLFLAPGSLLVMKPGMQQTHLHRIPKAGLLTPKPRVSMTFRMLREAQ